MRLIKFRRILPSLPIKTRNLTTTTNEEYTAAPEYPPIINLSYKAKRERKSEEWGEAIKSLKTVEEKQMKLNMPKYYGWKTIMLNDLKIPYNSMQFIQHCTRTHFKEVTQLPSFYDKINIDSVIANIKSAIEEALIFEHDGHKKTFEIYKTDLDEITKGNIISDSIIQHINRIMLNNLSSRNSYLSDSQVDYDPRHEAFWFVGGIYPPDSARKSRLKFPHTKEIAEEPINRAVQYVGKPSLALRTEVPLVPIISETDAENTELEVPFYNYDPRVLGYNSVNRHGTNIPGFWPGDPHEFGQLSFQKRSHMHNRLETFGERDDQEALHCHGIMSSFSWLLAQASYQGFTTYNDLTYPLIAQTIITNGKYWSFYIYQLNTIVLHSDHINNNPKRNICWGTTEQKLYEEIDANGKIIGFNDDIIRTLIKFYLNEPQVREGVEMKPYLDKKETVVANIADSEKREWLERQYKHMMSNRPRHRLPYEIYHWEKIYKIDHNTRVLEARKRPFEQGINPWSRRYDERAPSYIPKVLRPGGPKSKPKFYKSYYP